MVALPTDQLPVRGIVIGLLVLLSGTVTALFVDSGILPALVAAIVLLLFLLVEDQYLEGEEE